MNRLLETAKDGQLQGVIIPHTIVYRPADQVRWYYTSEKRGIVQKKSNQVNATAIRRAFLLQGAPEGPVAVWHSERKDSKGYLYSQECFDEKALCHFLQSKTDRGRCGVLQKFILPKDIKGKEGVNHELVVVSDNYLTIERRFNNAFLEPSKQIGLTQQACVHPPLGGIGKLFPPPCSATAPYQPNEVSVGFDELQSSALLSALCPAMRSITDRFCATRHDTQDRVSERELTCTFKVDRQNQLWLLGFVRLKSIEVLNWVIPDFELIKRRKKTAEGNEQEKAPEFNFALTTEQSYLPPPLQEATKEAAKQKKVAVRPQGRGMFLCPNCSSLSPRQEVFTTTYLSVLRYHDRTTRDAVKQMKNLVQGNEVPDVSQRTLEAMQSDEKTQSWAPLPPVLQRLSKSVEELRNNSTWLNRQVSLCRDCYGAVYDPTDENDQLQRCFERESSKKSDYLDRCAWNQNWGAESNRHDPDATKFKLVREMVFTSLQQHHRSIQCKTKQKDVQKKALQAVLHPDPVHDIPEDNTGILNPDKIALPCPPGGARPPGYTRLKFGPAQQPITSAWAVGSSPKKKHNPFEEEESADALLKHIEPEGASGTEFESSASAILSNYLYEEFGKQLQFGCAPEDGVEDVPADHVLYGVYSGGKHRLPLPHPRVVITVLPSDPDRVKERESSLQVVKHVNKVHAQITEVLPLFASLSEEEKQLLLSVVAATYERETEKSKQSQQKRKKDEQRPA